MTTSDTPMPTITDGFTTWECCRQKGCGLEVVRPGKVQCNAESCGNPLSGEEQFALSENEKTRKLEQNLADANRRIASLSDEYCVLERALTAEREKNARLVADLDNAWEQFRRMRALLAEAKYGDRLKNQVDVNAMKGKNDNQI